MTRHLPSSRLAVPTASVSRIGGRPTIHATSSESSAIGFGSAIGLATSTMVIGAALITTAPLTVTAPIAMVLGLGLIGSVVVAAGDRWLGVRRSTERHRA